MSPASVEGLVVRIEARTWTVEIEGSELPCSLKPSLFQVKSRVKNPVAVGDRVTVQVEGERGVIDAVLPRKNVLLRPTPHNKNVLLSTAANVDVLVVVAATKDPPLRVGLIDRFLVSAESRGMDALIVVNKCDEGDDAAVEDATRVYAEMGYVVMRTSATTGAGIDALKEALAGKTALFVGHSGVGKTSLTNALLPGLEAKIGDVAKHGRGRHTTTHVALYRLENGGHLVDSPGLREFGIIDVPKDELAILMPDLRPFAVDCKYSNCSHSHEPSCAVRAAVERGAVRRERYDSYLRILESLDDDGRRD